VTPRRRVASALALGLALRAAYAVYGHGRGLVPTVCDGYETIALNLLERGEYALEPGKPTSLREPGYPLMIAAVYGLAGGRRPEWILALQVLLGSATLLFSWSIGRRLFGEVAAEWGLWAAALYPPSVYYSAYFFRETLMAFLFTLVAWCSCRWSEPDSVARAKSASFGAGAAAAALAITNSAMIPALLLAGIGLWRASPAAARTRRSALFLAPILAAVGLWSWRNFRLHGTFVAGSTHVGEEFYQALITPPEDLGTQRQAEINAADPVFQRAAALPELEHNAVLLKAGGSFIASHPGLYASRVAARAIKLWRIVPYRRRYEHAYWKLVCASLLSDGWIVPLGFLGIWRFRKRWRTASAIPAGVIGVTAVYAALHAVIRYRVPLMPCVAVFAAAEARAIYERARASGEQSRSAAS